MALAFALSIALHEIAAGVVPSSLARAPERPEIVTRARIVRITQRPTPAPTPTTARVIPPAQRPAPVHPRTIAVAAEGRAGGRATAAAAPALPRPVRPFSSRPVWDVGAGHASSATSLAGNATSAGAGTGSGAQGNGNASASGDEPCGFVTFSDPHGSQFDPRTRGFWVDVRMSVHFADGSSQSVILDYPWFYASEAANPWSDQNLKDPSFPMRFQPPPVEKIAGEPPLVKYVIDRSTPEGMTLLRDCPSPNP